MSVLLEIDSIPIGKREKLSKELVVKSLPKIKKGKVARFSKLEEFGAFEIIDDKLISIPFSYCFQNFEGFPNTDREYPKLKAKFGLKLFDRQMSLRDEIFNILNGTRSLVLALSTGFGKTLLAIYLACKIGYKTIFVAHRVVLLDQIYNSIIRACGKDVKIQVVDSKCKIDDDMDFYIINAITLPKRDRMDFCNVGTLIADEVHMLSTEKFSRAFNWIFPKYSIGLTATPVRSDGQDRVIELYFGPYVIYRPLKSMFNVYLYYTNFIPKTESTENGDLIWNSVLESQAMDVKRNAMIIDICRYFTTRNILILCKRKTHAQLLSNGLRKYGIDSDVYFGSRRLVNYDCRVLCVTYSKGSTGFDHPKLDMLIIAGDVEENAIQSIGRVFRKEWHFPIIIDLIDKFRPLKNHADTRCGIYKDSGGEVKNLINYFNFERWRGKFNTDISDIYKTVNINEKDDEYDSE